VTRRAGVLAALACAAWFALAPHSVSAAGRYDPRLRFRSIRTAHFTIHYHQGEEAAAAHLASLVEPVRTELERRLRLAAPAHTHVVLVDQDDIANGWSLPFPYNLIELAATPPAAQSFLGQHDDWLRMVFTHEYTHTMHLDQVGGVMRLPRWLLGRHPVSFPNLFVPAWQIEGIATFAEGLAGLGRTHAADVASAIRAQRVAGRAPGLDRLAGGLVAWPSGWGPYFYGGEFIEYLAGRSGDQAIGELARRTSRRLPFFSGGAFVSAFGGDAASLWKAHAAAAHVPDVVPSAPAVRLTSSGYLSSTPRFDTVEGDTTVVYATSNAHTFPSLRRVSLDGTRDSPIASRFLGDGLSLSQGWIVYDEIDFRGSVARVSDLYALDAADGRRTRLSRGARLSSPDVTRDGTRLVAAQNVGAERALVVFPLSLGAPGTAVLGREPSARLRLEGCSFDAPRWSPDGRLIAATVSCLGRLPEIVVFDPAADSWYFAAPDARARDITPAWTPDGRWLLFASDRGGSAFAIYGVSAAGRVAPPEVRRVWSGPNGATSPDVSEDGTQLAFVGATPEGTDIFVARIPDPAAWPAADPGAAGDAVDARTLGTAEPAPAAADLSASVPYSPWSTLLPRYWEPIVEADSDGVDIGGRTAASDALGRHSYSATVIYAATRPGTSAGLPAASPLDWDVAYAYDRWRPTLFVSASGTTDHLSVRLTDAGTVLNADSRTTEWFGGLLVPFRHVRTAQAVLLGLSAVDQRIDLGAEDIHRRRNALRAAWAFASDRRYGYSVSPEDGVRMGVTAEQTLPALGADGRATTWTADARAYLPGGFAHAVVAVRAAVGSSTGDRASRRLFAAAGPGTPSSTLTFDRRALGLLRGIPEDDVAGTAVAGTSVDYRFPIVRIERGRGAWPVFVNTLHAAVFADYAAAGSKVSHLGRTAWSAGAEVSADITLGFGLRISATAGAAWTHDEGRTSEPGRAAMFVRTGYAF
jgi:hypothetical protein